jgi:hypothetical protein
LSKLITNNYKLNLATQLLESVSEEANNTYYLYAGKQIAGNTAQPIIDSVETTVIDQYRHMIFGQKINPSDVSLLIRNLPYASQRYAMYDSNSSLFDSTFYAICDEGSFYHVYKCLDNNMGANSTVEPEVAFATGATNYVFRTADGYVWKYIYSIDESIANYFKTENWFPVSVNTVVQANASNGSLDVIAIDGEGRGYGNYLAGTFAAGDLRITGNTTLYKISNSNMSFANGFYTGCLLYLTGGAGVGQYKTILNYYSNANGNFIVIEDEFDVPPVNGTQYDVSPHVKITGSGKDMVNAAARALVNANASNSIYRVEMLEVGENYDYAVATVVANDVVGVLANAIVRPIYSPSGGHGANAYAEFGAKTISFVTRYEGDNDELPANNDFSVIGLLKDPVFANVNITLANDSGIFLLNETVNVIEPVLVTDTVTINTTSALISSERITLLTANITNPGTSGSYVPGDVLIINDAGGIAVTNATLNVTHTEVRTAVVGNSGASYTNGDVVTLSTGTASPSAAFIVTTNSTGGPVSLAINNKGKYSANPTLANSAITGGAGTGLRVTVTMQIANAEIVESGVYVRQPGSTNNALIGGSGTGALATLTWDQTFGGSFLSQFESGQKIYITDNDQGHQLATVNNVANDTHMFITTNGYFTDVDALIYQPNIKANSTVIAVPNATHIRVSEVIQPLNTGDIIIGAASGARANISLITRNNVEKDFETFNQLYKYDIDIVSGTFQPNEQVYQGTSLANSTANAIVHSVISDGGTDYLYSSNSLGTFDDSLQIIGANSGAIATINEIFSPELDFGSGDILYIESLDAISRDGANQQFKLIFEL